MLIKELRGTESTQDACAKMRVSVAQLFYLGSWSAKRQVSMQIATFRITLCFIGWSVDHVGVT